MELNNFPQGTRSIAEETVGELEKEKTMKELEMRDAIASHRSELAAKDALVQSLRDRDHEMCATRDLQRKEVDELRRSNTALAERVGSLSRLQEEVERLSKKLNSEIMLKQQAVNKLAEIMNRYCRGLGRREGKKLNSEIMLKQQAVNKLAEIMNRYGRGQGFKRLL
ncbi:rho binding domain-containing protein [Phthorimaea operculella]|nr:rho binding domain-containing protein [Phthorimaea operculella]